MLVVENVSHGFAARTILENVSFRLKKGEHIALVGANGEGKSSFLNIITKNIITNIIKNNLILKCISLKNISFT